MEQLDVLEVTGGIDMSLSSYNDLAHYWSGCRGLTLIGRE